jgi:hypothetical protein
MQMTSRRWEARFAISHVQNFHNQWHLISFYGATVKELREAVRAYLTENRPFYFDNRGDHIAGHKIYFYSDGTIIPPISWGIGLKALSEGWWYHPRRLVSGHEEVDEDEVTTPHPMRDFEATVENFVTYDLIPRKGPDYQSRAMVGNQLQLPLLETILREAEEYTLNDLLQRGWHIVALEYKGELSRMGELANRKVIFVLGHPEVQAAVCAMDQHYYYRYG